LRIRSSQVTIIEREPEPVLRPHTRRALLNGISFRPSADVSFSVNVRFAPILLQKSEIGVRSISRKLTKRAVSADRCRQQAVTEVACEFIAR
jgi:hypothetical protein